MPTKTVAGTTVEVNDEGFFTGSVAMDRGDGP